MKRIRKHLPLLALTFLLAAAAVLAVPHAAEAAKSKKKSATLSVTNTKISGFREITGVVSLNDKYVIAFGMNAKGKNIYAYSKDGKTFTKAKKLGLTGDIYCKSAGKHLYVLALNNGTMRYKYVTNPTKLASAKAVKIYADFTNGYGTPGEGTVDSDGEAILLALAKKGESLVVLNKTTANVTDYAAMVEKKNSGKTVKDVSLVNCDASDSFRAYVKATVYPSKEASSGQDVYYLTKNGKKFTRLPDVPELEGYHTVVQWGGDQLYAYHLREDEGTLETSDGYPVYYVYRNNEWESKTAPVQSSGKYTVSGGSDDSGNCSAALVMGDTRPDYFCLTENDTGSCRICYTADGSDWTTLPAISVEEDEDCDVSVYQAKCGTCAVVSTRDTETYYRLVSGTWKEGATLTYGEDWNDWNDGYILDWEVKQPYALRYSNSEEKAVAYNLLTGESYTLPFQIDIYCYYTEDLNAEKTMVIEDNKVYGTDNAFKNVKVITLKRGSKKIKIDGMKKEIGVSIKGEKYLYLASGSRLYRASNRALKKAIG